jgi:HD-GYP domain-containing protein (c-di-GMP phosphodiesterase class II)
VAIADGYEEMISNRAYADIKTHAQAIEELRKNSSTQFDPKMVELFIELLPEVEE